MSVAALLRTRVRDCGHTLNMTGVELLDNDCLDLVQCLIDKVPKHFVIFTVSAFRFVN
jgi:hypothetical protein